jgi:hypothetical protein
MTIKLTLVLVVILEMSSKKFARSNYQLLLLSSSLGRDECWRFLALISQEVETLNA